MFIHNSQKFMKKYTINNLRTSLLNKKITNSYKIGFVQTGKKKNRVFKIVSMNWNKKVLDVIGYYNPKFSFSRIVGNKSFLYKLGKTILIDFKKIYYWLYKRALISHILFKIIRVLNIAYVIVEKSFLTSLVILDPRYYIKETSINQFYFFYNQIRSIDNIGMSTEFKKS